MRNIAAVSLDGSCDAERVAHASNVSERAGDDLALARAAQQNPAVFGALYERYRERIYWYLLARTGNADDAADLTQQVFLQALRALPQYRERKGTFSAWLFRIAHNAAINFRQRNKTALPWDVVEATQAPVAPAPEADVIQREALERLRTLFAKLDREKQDLLALRFVAGLTAAEIAGVIGKSEAATKKQLTRTLHRLQEQYRDTTS